MQATAKIVIVNKGGKGSGNFGHEGRPGLVGGSTTTGLDKSYTGPILGLKNIHPQYPVDVEYVSKTIQEVRSVVPSLPPVNFYIGTSPYTTKKSTTFGNATKTADGEPLIVIDVAAIDTKAEQAETYDDYDKEWTKEWFMVGELDRHTLRKHVIAHELGHKWWHSKSQKSADLVKLPSGAKGRVEQNPILVEWIAKWNTASHTMPHIFSRYSRDRESYQEAFADAFAMFVTGEPMKGGLEEWFVENVK